VKVYALFPTTLKEHVHYIFPKWRSKGYSLGLYVDPGCDHPCDLLIRGAYPGVWNAWNALARAAVASGADVCVLAGDDMECDPNHSAEEVGRIYWERYPTGDGVLQPTGDNQGIDDSGRPAAARICGSPIIGREWIKRAYQGNGPVDGRYNAFYADESLWHVSGKLGKRWMEPSLSHFHYHWSWGWHFTKGMYAKAYGNLGRQSYHERNQVGWLNDKRLFEEDVKNNFAGSEFL